MHEDGTGFGGDVQALPDEEDFSLTGDVLVLHKVLLSSGENGAQGDVRDGIQRLHLPDITHNAGILQTGEQDIMRCLVDFLRVFGSVGGAVVTAPMHPIWERDVHIVRSFSPRVQGPKMP